MTQEDKRPSLIVVFQLESRWCVFPLLLHWLGAGLPICLLVPLKEVVVVVAEGL
jgi:hypothetical protein